MELKQFIDEMRQAYKEDNFIKRKELLDKYGKNSAIFEEVEEVYSELIHLLGGFMLTIERKEQAHFNMLVDFLQEADILTEEQINQLTELETQLNNALEGEDTHE